MDLANSQFQISRAKSEAAAASAGAPGQANVFNMDPSSTNDALDSAGLAYQYEVARACGLALDKRILAFHEQPPVNDKEDLRAKYNRPLKAASAAVMKRRIPTIPDRFVLLAPRGHAAHIHFCD
jgi:hypothetical protein